MQKKKKIYTVPVIGFLIVIAVGTLLLLLPASNNGSIEFIDALFMATSSVCVTGLSTVVPACQFTLYGQIVLMVLSEIGAIGFMSFVVYILSIKNKKIKISDLLLAGESINETIYSNIRIRVKKIFKYTIVIESIGAVLLSVKLIPEYGIAKGAWYSLFYAVMAFCNSGMDIFGMESLSRYASDIYINIVFIFLIIVGGIGFFILEDILSFIKNKDKKSISFHSKLVLCTTSSIWIISVILIKVLSPNATILESIFTATTARTAGFYTKDISTFSPIVKLIIICLMFIGGAPGSNAGGIKVVVFAILILSMINGIKGRKNIVVFYRKISHNTVIQALTILTMSIVVLFVSIIGMSIFNDIGLMNIVFHCVSAFSTTGLELINSAFLNTYGKMTMILLMIIGRIGPIVAFRLFFNFGKIPREEIDYVEGKLIL